MKIKHLAIITFLFMSMALAFMTLGPIDITMDAQAQLHHLGGPYWEVTGNYQVTSGQNMTWKDMIIFVNGTIRVDGVVRIENCTFYVDRNKELFTEYNSENDYGIVYMYNSTVRPLSEVAVTVTPCYYNIKTHGKLYCWNTSFHIPPKIPGSNSRLFRVGDDLLSDIEQTVYLYDSYINSTDIFIDADGNLTAVNTIILNFTTIEYDDTINHTDHFAACANYSYNPIKIDETTFDYLDDNDNVTTDYSAEVFTITNREGTCSNYRNNFLNDTSVIHPVFLVTFQTAGGGFTNLTYETTFPVSCNFTLPTGWDLDKVIVYQFYMSDMANSYFEPNYYINPTFHRREIPFTKFADHISFSTYEANFTYVYHSQIQAVIDDNPVADASTTTTTKEDDSNEEQTVSSGIYMKINGEIQIVVGTTISFSGKNCIDDICGGIDNFSWLISDENGVDVYRAYGREFEYNFTQVGQFYVTLTVKDHRTYTTLSDSETIGVKVVHKNLAASTAESTTDNERNLAYARLVVIGLGFAVISIVTIYIIVLTRRNILQKK